MVLIVAPDAPLPAESTSCPVTVTLSFGLGVGFDTEALAESWPAAGAGVLVDVGGCTVGAAVGAGAVGVDDAITATGGAGVALGTDVGATAADVGGIAVSVGTLPVALGRTASVGTLVDVAKIASVGLGATVAKNGDAVGGTVVGDACGTVVMVGAVGIAVDAAGAEGAGALHPTRNATKRIRHSRTAAAHRPSSCRAEPNLDDRPSQWHTR